MAHRQADRGPADVLPAAAAGRKACPSHVPWPRSWPPPPRLAAVLAASPGHRRRRRTTRKPVAQGAGLAVRPAHRRPGPQRAVPVRRHRPVDRRRPRARRGRQEGRRRQGRDQGRRQERRASTSATATRASTPAPPRRPPCSPRRRARTRAPSAGSTWSPSSRAASPTAAPIAGRIQDAYDPTSEFGGDFANVIGQAYAAQALSDAKQRRRPRRSTAFLLQQQCSDGYFRSVFTADKTRADQSCQGARQGRARRQTPTPPRIAVLALQDVKGAKAKAAVKKAVAWLVDAQRRDGSFGGGKSTKDANANSTGLAGLGARRDRRHQARPAGRRLRCATSQVVGATRARSKLAEAGRRDRLRRRRLRHRPGLRASRRRPATSGGGPPRRRCRCCAGRRGPRATSPSSAPRTVAVGRAADASALTGVAPGERVCVSPRARRRTSSCRPEADHRGHRSRSPPTRACRTYRVWVGSEHRDVTVRVTG